MDYVKSFERLAMEIKGKDRRDAELHLERYGFTASRAAAIVALVTAASSQKVVGEVSQIAANIRCIACS